MPDRNALMSDRRKQDRGLLSRTDTTGAKMWYVRLWHDGRERRSGSFATKTNAREFYEKAKLEQKEGRFFPERYQHGGYDLVGELIDRYLETISTRKATTQRDDKFFGTWWKAHFEGKRLNAVTVNELEAARQALLKTVSPQRVNRYMAWWRHVLHNAIREGKLTSNPVLKLKMFKEPK